MTLPLHEMVVLAGLGQLLLAAASPMIPRVLRWGEGLAPAPPMLRKMFWVYAGYILATNLSFGLVSTFAAGWLLDGSSLGTAVCGFIAVYWLVRIVIQFTWFDRSEMLEGAPPIQRVGALGLEILFAYLVIAYGLAFLQGMGWL